mmetsp:Transcript_20635/g.30320  ORF Transcript_20635/g.30320 Transcript_20635/m.30320 type:complete len:145 (+) Transcript_20635:101-535(+)
MSRVPERSASAVALSIVTREGKPVYLKSFEPKDEIKYHFIIHAALDYFDEKQAQEKSSYLGNIAYIEDYRLYGYIANSGIKIILCTDDGKPIGSGDRKAFFDGVQQAYIDYAANPFVRENTAIVSKTFDARIERLTQQVYGAKS